MALYFSAARPSLPQTPSRERFGHPDPHLMPEPNPGSCIAGFDDQIIAMGCIKDQNNSGENGYNVYMADAKELLEQQFLEMRWRTLSLAADLDRIGRCSGGTEVLKSDPRVANLRRAFELLMGDGEGRAEKLQMIFSDMTPPPK
jgi:hypothetical protein